MRLSCLYAFMRKRPFNPFTLVRSRNGFSLASFRATGKVLPLQYADAFKRPPFLKDLNLLLFFGGMAFPMCCAARIVSKDE